MASALRTAAKRRTNPGAYKGALGAAKKAGLTVSQLDTSKSLSSQGIGEVAGEINQDRSTRPQELLAGLKRRKTASSRQRLLNRVLANYGITTGASGSKVNPRRF